MTFHQREVTSAYSEDLENVMLILVAYVTDKK